MWKAAATARGGVYSTHMMGSSFLFWVFILADRERLPTLLPYLNVLLVNPTCILCLLHIQGRLSPPNILHDASSACLTASGSPLKRLAISARPRRPSCFALSIKRVFERTRCPRCHLLLWLCQVTGR